MISYAPFWKTLTEKSVSTYALIFEEGLSANTLQRMRHNQGISTRTINELCEILNCTVQEIIEYRPDTTE